MTMNEAKEKYTAAVIGLDVAKMLLEKLERARKDCPRDMAGMRVYSAAHKNSRDHITVNNDGGGYSVVSGTEILAELGALVNRHRDWMSGICKCPLEIGVLGRLRAIIRPALDNVDAAVVDWCAGGLTR